MPIKFKCVCGQAYQAHDEHARKKVKCRACGQTMTIPHVVEQLPESKGTTETSEVVRNIVQKYAERLEGITFYVSPDIPDKKLQNAIEAYANDVNPEDVLVLWDATVLGSSKAGTLLTATTLHGNHPPAGQRKIDLVHIEKIRSASEDDTIFNLYVDGMKFVSSPSSEVDDFADMLREIVRSLHPPGWTEQLHVASNFEQRTAYVPSGKTGVLPCLWMLVAGVTALGAAVVIWGLLGWGALYVLEMAGLASPPSWNTGSEQITWTGPYIVGFLIFCACVAMTSGNMVGRAVGSIASNRSLSAASLLGFASVGVGCLIPFAVSGHLRVGLIAAAVAAVFIGQMAARAAKKAVLDRPCCDECDEPMAKSVLAEFDEDKAEDAEEYVLQALKNKPEVLPEAGQPKRAALRVLSFRCEKCSRALVEVWKYTSWTAKNWVGEVDSKRRVKEWRRTFSRWAARTTVTPLDGAR